jgi:hypothetical protein
LEDGLVERLSRHLRMTSENEATNVKEQITHKDELCPILNSLNFHTRFVLPCREHEGVVGVVNRDGIVPDGNFPFEY